MVDVWLKRRCLNSGCTRHVFYLTQWRTPPIYCNHCRLSEIDDLRSILVNYLDIEPKIRSLRKECGRLEDEQLSILRDRLLIKVRDLLKKCGYNFGYLVELQRFLYLQVTYINNAAWFTYPITSSSVTVAMAALMVSQSVSAVRGLHFRMWCLILENASSIGLSSGE